VNVVLVGKGNIYYRRYDFYNKWSVEWFSESYEEAIQKICCD
jgi:hypothetical protein